MNDENLEYEGNRMSEMLEGKVVKVCARPRPGEVVLIFEDGTRLFADSKSELEISIT